MLVVKPIGHRGSSLQPSEVTKAVGGRGVREQIFFCQFPPISMTSFPFPSET